MLTILGFAAQLIALISIAAIVISCVSSPQSSSVVISATCIPCAEVAASSDDDATQPVSRSALSMASPVYVTAIDEPVSLADGLSALTIRQLKALCKSRSVKGYGNLRKHELIALLQH